MRLQISDLAKSNLHRVKKGRDARAQGTYQKRICVTAREPLAGVPYDQTSFGLPSCAFGIIGSFALCGVRPRALPLEPTILLHSA